jgi:hypothetical protein
MKKAIANLFPVSSHRQEIVDLICSSLEGWIAKNEHDFSETFDRDIGKLLLDSQAPNAEFSAVHIIRRYQGLLIGRAVRATHIGDADAASRQIHEALEWFDIQISLDTRAYDESLRLFGAEETVFAQDLNFMLVLACTTLWLGSPQLVQRTNDWFRRYEENGHLADSSGDESLRKFVLWMLASEVAGAFQVPDGSLQDFGVYGSLIQNGASHGELIGEIEAASDFHLYRSEEFPDADPYPSFYGEVLGLFPAEVFAFATLRSRVAQQDTKIAEHPLLNGNWLGVQPCGNLPVHPLLAQVRHRFSLC